MLPGVGLAMRLTWGGARIGLGRSVLFFGGAWGRWESNVMGWGSNRPLRRVSLAQVDQAHEEQLGEEDSNPRLLIQSQLSYH
jgi:hypothetical protein